MGRDLDSDIESRNKVHMHYVNVVIECMHTLSSLGSWMESCLCLYLPQWVQRNCLLVEFISNKIVSGELQSLIVLTFPDDALIITSPSLPPSLWPLAL